MRLVQAIVQAPQNGVAHHGRITSVKNPNKLYQFNKIKPIVIKLLELLNKKFRMKKSYKKIMNTTDLSAQWHSVNLFKDLYSLNIWYPLL